MAVRSNRAKLRESKSRSHFLTVRRLKGSPRILQQPPLPSEPAEIEWRYPQGLHADLFDSRRFPLRFLVNSISNRALVLLDSSIGVHINCCELFGLVACCLDEWELEIDETKQVEEEKR